MCVDKMGDGAGACAGADALGAKVEVEGHVGVGAAMVLVLGVRTADGVVGDEARSDESSFRCKGGLSFASREGAGAGVFLGTAADDDGVGGPEAAAATWLDSRPP